MWSPDSISTARTSREERASRATTPPHGPADPLELLLGHLHGMVRVDAAAFLVVDDERTRIEPAARWFATEEIRSAIEPMLSRPYDMDAPGLPEAALERGRPLFIPCVEDCQGAPALKARLEGQKEGAGRWDAFKRASVITCPVRTPSGESLGALVVASADPDQPLRETDLKLIEVLADLAALSLERSDLLSAEAARGRTEMLLKRAAEGMSGTLESGAVYGRAVNHAVRLTRADHALLSRVLPGTSRSTVVAGSDLESEKHVDPGAVGEVARSRTFLMRDTSLHVPIALGPRLFGVLSVSREDGPAFDADTLDLLQKLAKIAAASIANAIDFERERRIARALTRGFVPDSLPRVPPYELGLLYEPADSQPTGGDLYGVWQLPDGQVALLVGDVAGKGVETAALSAMARFFIEARSWDCVSPGGVLAQANTMLADRLPSDTFVTAFFALLTPEGIRYANAGHLSPVVLRAGGGLEEARARGLPLGINESSRYENGTIDFAPGDLMLGFTDGLVEARKAGELYGSERLEAAIVAANRQASNLDDLVRLVFDDVRAWAGTLGDDAVALAVRKG